MAKSRRLRQARKNENEWSRVDLPSPPQFNGTNFAMWTSRMRVYLRYVDTLIELNDEVKDVLALHLIQLAVDDRLMQMIAAAKTSKEAMKILEAQFSARGSCLVETAIVVDEEYDEVVTDLASVSEVEHDQEACRESHSAVEHVEDADEDEAAIAAAESVEATPKVAGQPFQAESETEIEAATAAEVEEEQLTKSLPMRAIVFSNSDLDCECTGIARNQLTAESTSQKTVESNEELKAQGTYDEEILSEKELQNLKDEMKLIANLWNANVNEFENSVEESSMEAASDKLESFLKKEKNEKNQYGSCFEFSFRFDDLSSFVSGQPVEEMDDEHDEDEDSAENILMKWSLEEIRYYYELMLQQATDSHVADNMKPEDSMWEHHMMKATLNFIEDEHTWQQAIGQIEKKKKKTMKKDRFMKNRAKKKMRKIRKVPEFRVWSRRKKKKLHSEQQGQTNFGIVSLAET